MKVTLQITQSYRCQTGRIHNLFRALRNIEQSHIDTAIKKMQLGCSGQALAAGYHTGSK